MDFGGFQDDLFEDFDKKKENKEEFDWQPFQAEPQWFLRDCKSTHYESTSFNVGQFKANYFYYVGDYHEAVRQFEELKNTANTSHQLREVLEGYVRSLLRNEEVSRALEALNEFRHCCKNKEQLSSFYSLSAEIYNKSGNYDKELGNLKKLLKWHPLNSDFWLRTAECYASMADKSLWSIELCDSSDFTWKAAACLMRADLILKIGGNRETSGALKKKRNGVLIEKFEPVIQRLPQRFVAKCQEMMGKDVYYFDSQQEESEFIDLGSSSRTKQLETVETEEAESEDDEFEKHWFSFFDSVEL